MIFRRFPYTTLNDLNLDWIIKQVRKLSEDVAEINPERMEEVAQQAAAAEQTAQSAETAAQTAIAPKDFAVMINGARPSMAVRAGQYVIVRASTISGIMDGLYTAVNALSPSTDVTSADLTAVSGGGLNDVTKSVIVAVGIDSTYHVSYRASRMANVVVVSMNRETNHVEGPVAWSTIFTLPPGNRPPYIVNGYFTGSSNQGPVRMRVLQNGDCQIYHIIAEQLGGNLTFIV